MGKIRPSFRPHTTTTAQLPHSSSWCFSSISGFDREVIGLDTFWRNTLSIYPKSSLWAYSCRRNSSCGWSQPGVPADQPPAQHHLHSLYVRHQRASHQPDHQHQFYNSYVQSPSPLPVTCPWLHIPPEEKQPARLSQSSSHTCGCRSSHVLKGHPNTSVGHNTRTEF